MSKKESDKVKDPEESNFSREKLLKLWQKIDAKRKERAILRKMKKEKSKNGTS